MRVSRSAARGAAVIGAAAVLVAAVIVVRMEARAAATPASVVALTAKLADRSAGSYYDRASGKMVVTLTDVTAEQQVRAAGAVPRLVKHSAAQLRRAAAMLNRSARVAGTAWSVDPATNQVVVYADSTVTSSRMSRLRSVTGKLGDVVRVQSARGRFTTRVSGGDAIYGGQFRCSLGFNVSIAGAFYFLTAGHCGNVAATWSSNAAQTNVLGTVADSKFPGTDFALVKYTGVMNDLGVVDLYNGNFQDITSAADAFVGETVTRSGSTSGVHGGTVTALNATVNYAEGTVTGLIQTTVCAEAGDSGGPLFAGPVALGLTSGGSGNCTTGGITFFQPVTAALQAYGATVF